MSIFDLLKSIGIESPVFIAGASGSIAFLTKNNKMSVLQKFLTVLSGGLSANYLTPLVGNWLGLDDKILFGVAFLLGYSGMKSVEVLITEFFNKIKK